MTTTERIPIQSLQPGDNKSGGHRAEKGLIETLNQLGTVSLLRQIAWLSCWSLISGLSQAALLVIVSQIAVTTVQSGHGIAIKGMHLSTDGALVCSAFALAIYFLSSLIAALASASMSRRSLEAGRGRMIRAFFKAGWPVQSSEKLGHVQQLLSVNCENIGNILLTISGGIQSILSVIALLIAAFFVNPIAAALVLLFGLILFALLRPFNKLAGRASFRLALDSAVMSTSVTEYSRLTRELRLMGVENRALDHLDAANSQAASTFQKSRNISQINPVIYQTCALGFLLVGMAVLLHNERNLASTGAVLLLILRSLTYGSGVQSTMLSVSSFKSYLQNLTDNLDRYTESSSSTDDRQGRPSKFGISFENVSYSYDQQSWALDDVSFTICDGATIGIMGRSGSGKTTLTQLLLGMRRPTQGRVLIGGTPADELAIDEGRSSLAIVPQEPILLRGSIAFNIAFFRDCTREEVVAAARAAHLHDEIIEMPDGYETPVGEGGGALSGGQRQRLAIARALLGSPRLLVLDEPTSALDGRSEGLVRQTLAELRGNMTVVIISHRLAAVEDCDMLLVLEKGHVADFGARDTVHRGPAFRAVVAAENVSPQETQRAK